jgi:HPt (histidine-containing phosphotransfer) domain-containing protein
MCSYNDKETLSTLRFGYRAKSIKNKPLVNEEKSAKELQILLDHAKKTIQQLTDQLKASGKLVTPQAGTVLTNDERERYEAKIQELKDELMNRSDPVNTSIGTNSEMELRIKQLLLENNSLSHKLNTDVERLEQENRKHIETIESLFTKEATL